MKFRRRLLILSTALALAAMPVTGAFAQAGGGAGGSAGGASLPSQRITITGNGGGGAPLMLSSATVRRVRQRLNRLGYRAGPVIGRWNRETRVALIRFQKARGLEPTGTIDLTTLRALRVEPGLGMAGRGNEYGNGGRNMAAASGRQGHYGVASMRDSGIGAAATGGEYGGEGMNGSYGGAGMGASGGGGGMNGGYGGAGGGAR